ncbi:MAG: glycosyltransferase family 4 protein [Ferruginibacter sp.]
MKILHLLYPGLGGHGNVFFTMCKADVTGIHQYEAVFAGIEPVRAEYAADCKTLGIPFTYVSKTPGKHAGYFKKILKILRRSDADIIFLHGSSMIAAAWAACLMSKKKIVVRETQAIHLKSANEQKALKIAMGLADAIVFLSEAYKMEIKEAFEQKFRSAKCHIIPNGIDLDYFKPDRKRKPLAEFVFSMQSRIIKIKDHSTLIKAFKILCGRHPQKMLILNIAGDGDQLEKLKVLTRKLNLENSINFTGILPQSRLAAFLNNTDIYIHASFGETMSTAIMQAMACGKPIIASDVEGINNMVKDNDTGLLVKVKHVEALANTMENLMENTLLAKKISENARGYAQEHFSKERMFRSYNKLFTGIS